MEMNTKPVWLTLAAFLLMAALSVPERLQAQQSPQSLAPPVKPGLAVDDLLLLATSKIRAMEEPVARELLEEVLEREPDNMEALWKLSLLYSKAGHRLERRTEKDLMMDHYREAEELADACVTLYPDQAECHYVMAVAVGRISDISRARDRVRASRRIKEHVDRTLELDPEHRGAWHLLGVWHSSVANTSGTEKFAAGVLYGGIPKGSNEEAEEALKKAVELDPENILFNLDLARHYLRVDRKEEAIELLERIRNMEIRDMDDPANLERVERLLNRHR